MGNVKKLWCKKIVNVIKDILNVKKSVPVGIKWKEEKLTGSIQTIVKQHR
jgi:hypothetical protein